MWLWCQTWEVVEVFNSCFIFQLFTVRLLYFPPVHFLNILKNTHKKKEIILLRLTYIYINRGRINKWAEEQTILNRGYWPLVVSGFLQCVCRAPLGLCGCGLIAYPMDENWGDWGRKVWHFDSAVISCMVVLFSVLQVGGSVSIDNCSNLTCLLPP